MTNHEIWQTVLAEFELTLSRPNFTTWFRNTGIASYDGGHVVICVPSAFNKSWLEKKYQTEIIKTIERTTGKPVKKIEYTVDHIKNISEQEIAPTPTLVPTTPGTASTHHTPAPYQTPDVSPPIMSRTVTSMYGLNQKYTFGTFIVGKGNELAHAAAQAVAARPGEAYNPLFIYGGVGLGKTHLIQAIGNTMLEKNPNTKILYINSEKFTNEFVTAMQEGRGKEFKNRYRNVDLLLMDDIQFIGGKEVTQEEFFHTFNELHQQGKQVVLTSDRPPKAIPALEDRVRSRFEWGMIVDISAPDLETRAAILQAKCREKGFPLEPKLIHRIATSIQSNIRELEGALNKIIAFHQLKNIPATEESVTSVIATFEAVSFKKSVTPRDIIHEVAKFYDITIEDIAGKSREKKLAHPRQMIMFLLRNELKMSFPAIGNELGGRDHTTAMHAHSKIALEIENEPKLKQDIDMIKQRLYTNSI